MTRRRIVVVNDDSIARGGTAVLAVMSAKALAARGHEVIWLCGDAGANPSLAEAGIEVVALGSRPLLDLPARAALVSGVHNAPAARMIRAFLAERDTPDTVYHVHSWAQIFSPALFPALAPVGKRALLHAHDMFLACPNGVFMDYRKNQPCTRRPVSAACVATHCDKRSYAQKLWRVARGARVIRALGDLSGWGGIVVIHPAMKAKLARAGYPEARMHTVRNPVVPFSAVRIRAEDNRGLLYVGRLEADKGVGELASAAARAGVPLTLVGEGPMRAEISARYPAARLAGWVDKAGIAPFAAEARALVMPSRHPEPFALVIAEAQIDHSANYRSAVVCGICEVIDGDERATVLDLFTGTLIPGRDLECPPHTARDIAQTLVLALPITVGRWISKARRGPAAPSETAWTGTIPVRRNYGAPQSDSSYPVPLSVERLVADQ